MEPTATEADAGIDREFPQDSAESAGAGGPQRNEGNDGVFQPEYNVTVGRTLVLDKSTGEEQLMWKAHCGSEEHIDTNVVDAMTGAVAKANGGEIP